MPERVKGCCQGWEKVKPEDEHCLKRNDGEIGHLVVVVTSSVRLASCLLAYYITFCILYRCGFCMFVYLYIPAIPKLTPKIRG